MQVFDLKMIWSEKKTPGHYNTRDGTGSVKIMSGFEAWPASSDRVGPFDFAGKVEGWGMVGERSSSKTAS